MTAGGCRRSRALGRGHDERDAAVALLAAVEEPQHWLDDPAGLLMVGQGDGALVEPRGGVGRRVLAIDHRDAAKVLVGGTVLVHVATRVQCHPTRWREMPIGSVHVEKRGQRRGRHARTTEAHARAFVEGAVAHDDVGGAGGDGHRRLHDDGARCAPAVRDARERRKGRNTEVPAHLDLLAGIHREGHESVDVARPQAGVVERGLGGLAGELELAATRLLGELGLADADDGSVVPERSAHDRSFASGMPITAVPET